jgi:hypothetical protein
MCAGDGMRLGDNGTGKRQVRNAGPRHYPPRRDSGRRQRAASLRTCSRFGCRGLAGCVGHTEVTVVTAGENRRPSPDNGLKKLTTPLARRSASYELAGFCTCVSSVKLFTIEASSNRRTSRAGVPRAEISRRQTDATDRFQRSIQPQPGPRIARLQPRAQGQRFMNVGSHV